MTPSLIVDCSVTMAWCFADEGTEATRQIQDRLLHEAVAVPSHWTLEVANMLVMAEKRKRISAADATHFVKLLSSFDFQADDESSSRVFDHVLPISRSQGLTSYDAAYIDLALRRRLPLATLDLELRRVATNLGIEVLGK